MKPLIILLLLSTGTLSGSVSAPRSGTEIRSPEIRETIAGTGQQRLVRLTRYEGQMITGIEASSAFDVTLIHSPQTRVVAEINEELEDYLTLTLRSDGVVRVAMNNPPRIARNHTQKLTVYLPEISYLKASGASTIRSTGNFTATDAKILLSSSADLKSLELKVSQDLHIEVSSAATAKLTCESGYLNVKTSGSANLQLHVHCQHAKISCSSASDARIDGTAGQVSATASSAATLQAQNFKVKEMQVSASGASNVRLQVSESLKGSASSAASIRWKGNPVRIDNKSSSGGSIRKVE